MTSSGEAFGADIVALQPSTLVVVYSEATDIVIRRSTDSGATWSSPNILATYGADPSISGRGNAVDVVWREDTGSGTVIRYARSSDGGASFAPSVAVSSSTGSAWWPSVDRGPHGVVAIAWYDSSDWVEPKVRSRVSVDGGTTFGLPTTPVRGDDIRPAVAVGAGVIYLGYSKHDTVWVKRSTNAGLSWRSAQALGNAGHGYRPSITASGSDAYVAYSTDHARTRYTRTIDKGASWMAPRYLSPRSGAPSGSPVISLHDGVVRAAFARRVGTPEPGWALFYRRSADGITWSPAERVTVAATPSPRPTGLDVAGRAVVVFTGNAGEDVNDIFAVTRNP